jgi:hypothetical protein
VSHRAATQPTNPRRPPPRAGLAPAAAQHHSKQAPRPASSQGGSWRSGRISFYGQDGGSTINDGSCMFGYLDPSKGTGADIAALTDGDPDYQGSCGCAAGGPGACAGMARA